MKIIKKRKNKQQKKDISNSILFLLLLFWLFIQGISFSSLMLTGSSTANVTSATGTVSFTVIRPAAAPTPAVPVVIAPAAITASIPSFGHLITPTPAEKVEEIVQPTPIVEMPAPALFDIALEPLTPEITVGQDMTLKLSFTNFVAPGAVPVTVTYTFFDELGNVVYTEEKLVTVETQMELLETISLPPDISAGTYSLSVTLSSDGQTAAESSTTFTVAPSSESQKASPLQTVREFGAAAVNKVNSFFHTVTEGIARWFFGFFE